MSLRLINIIFGMKVRQARLDAGLTLSEFANSCELSPSYVTEAVNKFSDSSDPQGNVWEARSVDNSAGTVDNQMFLGKSCDT